MTQAAPTRDRPFESIQILRALAALMVVAYHVKVRIGPMGYRGAWPEWLGCGVDIFFVISGFIMWMTTCDRPTSPAAFLRRRLLRIVPLYWLVTGVVVAVSLVAPSLAGSAHFDLPHTIASLLFVVHPNSETHTFEPVVPQGWTLNYEMEFYVLFAVWLPVATSLRRWMIPLSLGTIAVAGLFMGTDTVAGFYTSSLILEFGFGVVLAIALQNGMRLAARPALLLVVLGAAGVVASWPLVAGGWPRVWASGLSATLIVAGAVLFEETRRIAGHGLLRLLGDASYSIYLTHGLALTAAARVWVALLGVGPLTIALFVPAGITAAALAGVVVHLLVERPVLDGARRLTRTQRPLTVAAPAAEAISTTARRRAAPARTSATTET